MVMMNGTEQPGIYLRTMADMLGEWELLRQEDGEGGPRGRNHTPRSYSKTFLRALVSQIEQETGQPFALQEKMLWTPDEGFFLQELHLERLDASAAAFGIPYDPHKLRTLIQKQLFDLVQPTILTIQLTLQSVLHLHKNSYDGPAMPEPLQLTVASSPINRHSPLLYYSTTYPLFDQYVISQPHKDGLLLWNERSIIK